MKWKNITMTNVVPSPDTNTPLPGSNPTVVFVLRQVSSLVATLAGLVATLWAASSGYIHDGEVVTLLLVSIGFHVVGTTVNALPTSTAVPAPSNVVVQSAPPAVVVQHAETPAQPTTPQGN